MFTLNAELHRRRSGSGGSYSDMSNNNGDPTEVLPPPVVVGGPPIRHRRDLSNNSFLQLFHGSGGRANSQPHMPSLDHLSSDEDLESRGSPTAVDNKKSPTSTDGLPPKPPATTSTTPKKPKTWMEPAAKDEARLTICQITDVYTLDNFASLKHLLRTMRQSQNSTPSTNKCVSMLTGDFLSPYLLSSVDRGAGMMNALTQTPIDILTWG